jgi:hypothetical protein
MRNHRLNGFSLIDSIGPLDGELVQQLELDVKREVRRLRGGERGALLFGERFDGWTESWPTQDFPVSSMQELLRVCSPYFVLPVP